MAQLTIQQALDLAVQHHQAGRLREAEQIYRQILVQQPQHVDAMHFLGVVAYQAGRNDAALELIRRAIAFGAHSAEVHINLGNTLQSKGELDQAIAAFRQAIALKPDFSQAHFNLGNVLIHKGQLDEAIAAFRQAVTRRPDLPQAHNNLGNVLQSKGQLDEAIAAFRRAIVLRPDLPEAYNNLGNVLKETGQFDEAIAAFRDAIARRPDLSEAYNNLGNVLREKDRFDEAIAAFRQAIALRPDLSEAYNNLGNAMKDKGQFEEAISAYRQAINLNSKFAEAYANLGIALKDNGQLDEAIDAYQDALTIRPSFAEVQGNLGMVLIDKGRLDEAITIFRRAIAADPDNIGLDSSLLFTLHFHPGYSARAIADEERRWNRQHAVRLSSPKSEPPRKLMASASTSSTFSTSAGQASSGWAHPGDRSADRQLRIGYISPDLRDHVVGRNILPLFQQHNRQQFEITCYAQVRRPDAMTRQLQQTVAGWRTTIGLSDEQLAERIRQDRIDILVDLALHTANNRLLVFARKPAPVQVTFAGYPGSTGLCTIDYRLSDPYLDPPGMDESVYSEKTIRLADSFWCYDPLDCREIPINSLPALESGVVTFGCLNKFCKINDSVLTFWAHVLRQVENSRLLLLAPQGRHRQATRDRLGQQGIDPSRIEFVPHLPRREYLTLYHRIDLGLDSFPYNGHTTSLDSFWMGVPVVTLVGQRVVSRAGWSQVSNLGLSELAAQTPEQYVRIAVELANDLPRLKELRSTLRQRMEQSPLMDAPKFAWNIEAAYRQMWQTWCEMGSDKSD